MAQAPSEGRNGRAGNVWMTTILQLWAWSLLLPAIAYLLFDTITTNADLLSCGTSETHSYKHSFQFYTLKIEWFMSAVEHHLTSQYWAECQEQLRLPTSTTSWRVNRTLLLRLHSHWNVLDNWNANDDSGISKLLGINKREPIHSKHKHGSLASVWE